MSISALRSVQHPLRSISQEELTTALADHEKFIESQGCSGSSVGLRFTDLKSREIKERNLSQADLEGADLSGATLCGTNLEGSNLQNTTFQGADVRGVNFRNAHMKDADLSGAVGLLTKQLAGTDLCCTRLPEAISDFSELDSVAEASKNATIVFITTLAACLYSLLTINSTRDPALVANSGATVLPLIGMTLPILGFYLVTPVILICIYIYFHLQLLRLWELLADLPAIFPNGVSLNKKAYPWLFNGIVVAYLPRLIGERPRLWRFQKYVSMILGCWIVPLTLAAFWLTFLKKHEWTPTTIHLVVLVMAIAYAVYFHSVAQAILRHKPHRPVSFGVTVLIPAILLVWLSASGIAGLPPEDGGERGKSGNSQLRSYGRDIEDHSERPSLSTSSAFLRYPARLLAALGLNPVVDLRQGNVSTKPDGWTDEEKSYEALGSVRGAILPLSHLEYALASGAFLVKANLYCSNLRGAQLDGADLRGSDLRYGYLQTARLTNARLAWANLEGCNASGVVFDSASLHDIHAQRIKLLHASLMGVSENKRLDFRSADLRDADFGGAEIQQVDFSGANLAGSRMGGLQMSGLTLTGVDLSGADLERTTVQNARFDEAILDGTLLSGTSFLSDVHGLTKDQLRRSEGWLLAFYDERLRAELGLPAVHTQSIRNRRLDGYDFSKIDLGDRGIGNLKGFDLRKTKNLPIDNVRKSRNWLLALYNTADLNNLNLDNNHNKNLSAKDFSHYDLSDSVLHRADLEGFKLIAIQARRVSLDQANLKGADLTGSVLEGATLTGADLSSADLSNSNLKEADLTGATVSSAKLEGADLRGANLSDVVGLTREHLQKAKLDNATRLPSYVSSPVGKTQAPPRLMDSQCPSSGLQK